MVGRPRLTIATVVKDDDEGLRRTLDSLASALTQHEQLLIIDSSVDASATRALIAMTGVSHDYAWVEPQGVYAAMNTALDLAEGEYIWFVNAGDQLHSQAALADVRYTIAGDPQWAYGRVRFHDVHGRASSPPNFDYEAESRAGFARGLFPSHQGTIVRTEALKDIGGFDTTFSVAADYVAMLRFSQLARPAISDAIWADFYEGGLSTQRWRTAVTEFHRARRLVLKPTGLAALVERAATAQQLVTKGVYRTLLAPGRPLGHTWTKIRRS